MELVLTNHIPHINKLLEINTEEHKETQEMLIKIMERLKIK